MEPGADLGPYRIDRELGSGGMGTVYAATGSDGTVALKVVHPHLLEAEGVLERFRREAEIGLSVRHPNVVRTHDYREIGGAHVLVMEYVEGQTLSGLRAELERVPEELCRHVAREVCKGLAAIQDAGVVHRDLKPDNVLITPDHVVKVMDLGVAKLVDAQLRLSQTGAFIGSVEYAAPEQFTGGETDHRTDLHALGVVLYELATGLHPYRGGSFHEVLRRVCEEAPRPLGQIDPQVSAFFEEVVHTLLVKDPRGRFASAAQLLDVLDRGEESTWWRDRSRAIQAETRRPVRRIRIPRETAVYGREDECRTLRELYGRASTGDGRVVLVEGEAGIGKSRLVDEFIARLQSDGESVNFLFGSFAPEGAGFSTGAFSTAYGEHLGEGGSADVLAQSPALVPAFDALLRGEPAPHDAVPLTRESLGTCFVHATRALAAERPTIVLIDDLHFAPPEARALFTLVAIAVPGHRVLLIGTMRPGVPEDWVTNLTRQEQTSRMELARLGPKDLASLLRDSLRSEALARSLGMQIAAKSDGNPFFAFEIIQGLREEQFLTRRADGSWTTTRRIDEIRIPSSVLDLVNARVADLTQEERDALDVAACWGYQFDPLLVGEVLGMARIPLLKLLSQIERKHRLVRSTGKRFVFDHHQVQEALYQGLPELLRESYHAALAEALEARSTSAGRDPTDVDGALCLELCEQFLRGARGDAAKPYLVPALTHLAARHLHARAVSLGGRALSEMGLLVGVERADILLRLDAALDMLGHREQQEEYGREALRLAEEAGDEPLAGRAAACLGMLCMRTTRYTDAERWFSRALEIARANGDRRATASALGSLGYVLRSVGRGVEAREHCEAGLAIRREIADRSGEAAETVNLGILNHSQGRLPEARECYERAREISRETGDVWIEANATGNLGGALMLEGQFDAARQHLERQLEISREIGNRNSEAGATAGLANVYTATGHLVRARELNETLRDICREIGFRHGEAVAMGNLGAVSHLLGQIEEALDHHGRYLALCREFGDREGEAHALHNLGATHREDERHADAEESLGASLVVCEEIGRNSLAAETQLILGSLRAAHDRGGGGHGEPGRAALEAARDLARDAGLSSVEVLARCELARLPDGDTADALARFTEHEERLGARERREARFLLWSVSRDRTHLEDAKRLMDESLSGVPDEYRDPMRIRLRVNREILAAWREEFGDTDAPRDDDGSTPTESPTRAG